MTRKVFISLFLLGVFAILVPHLLRRIEIPKSREVTVLLLSQVKSSLVEYHKDCQMFPSQDEGLLALVVSSKSCEGRKMRWPYLREVPGDGWGNSFEYSNDGKKVVVGTIDMKNAGNRIYIECDIRSVECDEHF